MHLPSSPMGTVKNAEFTDKPREAALRILRRVEGGMFADALIERARQVFNDRDNAFIHELVYGVLRNRSRLDWIIDAFSAQPVTLTDSWTRNLIRLGVYQLLFLDRVPVSAAVNTATELAKSYGKKTGYVNGLLRNLDRKRATISYPGPEDKIRQLSILYSHPNWLVERWVEHFGVEKTESLLKRNNLPAPLIIRTNILKTTREELKHLLTSEGAEITNTRYSPVGLHILSSPGLNRMTAYVQGLFMIQDQAAQLISILLRPDPGDMVLDACSAPGGKATHLAEMMRNTGTVIALEKDSKRIMKIQQNSRRLGLSIIAPMLQDASLYQAGSFDKILIDAPCSGLGVLRRHPEGRWNKNETIIIEHQRLQKQILENCVNLLKLNGILVYATCSTEPEENESVVADVLGETKGRYDIEDARKFLPSEVTDLVDGNGFLHTYPLAPEMDGFFAVRLRRKQ